MALCHCPCSLARPPVRHEVEQRYLHLLRPITHQLQQTQAMEGPVHCMCPAQQAR